MREFTVSKGDAGQRLDKYLGKILADAPQSLIYKSLRKKRIKLNGKKGDAAYRLQEGDILSLYINDEFFAEQEKAFWESLPPNLNVVYEDDNILIANKPSGLLSQSVTEPSLEGYFRSYLLSKDETIKNQAYLPSLCHRIDRNTSGLVIAAKNSEAHKIISEKIKNKEIRKFYLCETEAVPNPVSGKISGYLLKSPHSRKMEFLDNYQKGAVKCETAYQVVKRQGVGALVEAEIYTGRTHQIRASFAKIGCPLVGDVKYGAKKNGESNYQHLTAYKLIFDFVTDSGDLEYLKGKVITL